MGMHDRMAYLAHSKHWTAEHFHAGAQRQANATWFFGIVALAIWYFAGWGWALIPTAIAALYALNSISKTMIGTRLERIASGDLP